MNCMTSLPSTSSGMLNTQIFWRLDRETRSSMLALKATFSSVTGVIFDWRLETSCSRWVILSLWLVRLVSVSVIVVTWATKVDPIESIDKRRDYSDKFSSVVCSPLIFFLSLSSSLTNLSVVSEGWNVIRHVVTVRAKMRCLGLRIGNRLPDPKIAHRKITNRK